MAFVQSMALRTPYLHISSIALRISSAILQSSNLRLASRSHKHFAMDPVSASKSGRVDTTLAQSRDEEAEAKVAAATVDIGASTIFNKIISKEIPATIVYKTEKVLAFRDINPQAPMHVVLIPKKRDGLTQLSKATEENKDMLGDRMDASRCITCICT